MWKYHFANNQHKGLKILKQSLSIKLYNGMGKGITPVLLKKKGDFNFLELQLQILQIHYGFIVSSD